MDAVSCILKRRTCPRTDAKQTSPFDSAAADPKESRKKIQEVNIENSGKNLNKINIEQFGKY